jgi:hypothetical protein
MSGFRAALRALVGSLIVSLPSGCGTGDRNNPNANRNPSLDVKVLGEAPSVLIKSKDGLSEVRVPADWQEIDGLNDAAVLQAGNHQQKAYFVVRTYSKRDWPGDENLQKYAKIWVEEFRESFADSRLESGPLELTINGRPAIQYEFSAIQPPNKTRTMLSHTTVSGRAHLHELVAWTNQRRAEENRAMLQAIVTSFMELKGKAEQ